MFLCFMRAVQSASSVPKNTATVVGSKGVKNMSSNVERCVSAEKPRYAAPKSQNGTVSATTAPRLLRYKKSILDRAICHVFTGRLTVIS